MRGSLASGLAAIASLIVVGIAQPCAADDEMDPVVMAHALEQASVSLDQALRASEARGKPISAKFEMENGGLQLSVYTMNPDHYNEVIVDHKSGAIARSESITEGDDLKEAGMQGKVMTQARRTLEAAVNDAVKANAGYRAVSVMPALDGGRPVATVTLLKGQAVKKVTEKLD